MLHGDGEKFFEPYASLKDGRLVLAVSSHPPGAKTSGWFTLHSSRSVCLSYNGDY
jgi:hypothetical protein